MERDFQRNPEEETAQTEVNEGGNFECFCCGRRSVIWGGEHSYEDYCMEGDGIVGNYHCTNCGAEFLCFTSNEEDQECSEQK